MSKKAKRKRYGEPAHCLWCGVVTDSPEFVVNPGGTPVLKCCCETHFEQVQLFIDRDNRYRQAFWIALFICCVGNIAVFALEPEGPVAYLPLLAFSLVVIVWPSLFVHYEFYANLGLVTTRRIFRVLAALMGLLAICSAVSAWLSTL